MRESSRQLTHSCPRLYPDPPGRFEPTGHCQLPYRNLLGCANCSRAPSPYSASWLRHSASHRLTLQRVLLQPCNHTLFSIWSKWLPAFAGMFPPCSRAPTTCEGRLRCSLTTVVPLLRAQTPTSATRRSTAPPGRSPTPSISTDGTETRSRPKTKSPFGNNILLLLLFLKKPHSSKNTCGEISRHSEQFCCRQDEDERNVSLPGRQVGPLSICQRCNMLRESSNPITALAVACGWNDWGAACAVRQRHAARCESLAVKRPAIRHESLHFRPFVRSLTIHGSIVGLFSGGTPNLSQYTRAIPHRALPRAPSRPVPRPSKTNMHARNIHTVCTPACCAHLTVAV